jgi:hypothetical protein
MLRVYTAWADGAIEADAEAIKRAMQRRPRHRVLCVPVGSCDLSSESPPHYAR